tara:strand:- start:159 stop:761 length:603 start_codon:yes stop_codon:yes gene_type:complete
MKKKRKKIVYNTAPLFVMVSICFTITLFISIFILNVENFYSSGSKQVGKKKALQTFCILKPTTSNIYGDKACDKSTYVEFDIFQYIDENDYHIIRYARGTLGNAGQRSRCGLRKDYQFGDWSQLVNGKPISQYSGDFSYTLRQCIEYVIEDFCSSEFFSYDIYSFSKKGWKYDCRIDHSLFGPNIVKKAEKYIKKTYSKK